MARNDDYEDILHTATISDDLDGDLRALPKQVAHWGWLAAQAYEQALQAKADRDQKYAETYERVKVAQKAGFGDGKLTEKALEALIETDPEYRRYVSKWIEAEGKAKKLGAAVAALQVKNSSLMQLGANERQANTLASTVPERPRR